MDIYDRSLRPLFSVLMLTYNHQEYIAEAVVSILNQTYKDFFEFIILDDFSSDDTWGVVRNVISNLRPKHINIIAMQHKKNMGSINNFNYGVSLASGEIIVVADGDDISHKSRLERLRSLHFNYSKSLYISNARIIRQGSELNSFQEKRFYDCFNLDNLSYRDIFTNKTPVFGASYAFSRMLFDEFGKIDPVWVTYNNVDQYIFWKAYLRHGIFYTDECLIDYRIHEKGLSINRFNYNLRVKNQENYFLNRMGNVLYLLQDIIMRENCCIKDSEFLFEKIKDDFSRLNSIIREKGVLNNMSADKLLWIGRGGRIVFNGVVVERNIYSLKNLQVDELIFVLNFLLLDYDLDTSSVLQLSHLCRKHAITKNEIIVLFYIMSDKNNNLINLNFSDKIYLFWNVISKKFRVFKILHEVKK